MFLITIQLDQVLIIWEQALVVRIIKMIKNQSNKMIFNKHPDNKTKIEKAWDKIVSDKY